MTFNPTKAAEIFHEVDHHRRKLLEAKAELEKMSKQADGLGELSETFVLARECAECASEATKELNKFKDYMSYSVLPEAFTEEGLKTITTDSGYRVTITAGLSVTMANKEKGFEWLKENGYEALIQETVNSSALKAAVKRMLEEEGVEPPSDAFNVKPAPYSSVTKVKK